MKRFICILLAVIVIVVCCTGAAFANTVTHNLNWDFTRLYDEYFDGRVNRIFYDFGGHYPIHPDARASAGIEIAAGMTASSEMTIYAPNGSSARKLEIRSTSGWCTTEDAYIPGQRYANRLYAETYRNTSSTSSSTTYLFTIT